MSRVNGGKHAIYALSINPFFWVGDIYAQTKEKGREIADTPETKPLIKNKKQNHPGKYLVKIRTHTYG